MAVRSVVFERGLGKNGLHYRFHAGENPFRAAGAAGFGPRRRLPLAAEDDARFGDKRGLYFRAADVNAEVETFACLFGFHGPIVLSKAHRVKWTYCAAGAGK